MSATLLERPVLPADPFVGLEDPERYEFANGELVERQMSYLSSWVGSELHRRLSNFVLEHGLGQAVADGLGFKCFRDDPRKVRRPDVSFIQKSRITREVVTSKEVSIAPDLAVEVVSPNDYVYESEAKIKDYLDAGVRLVWVINPDSRIVQVYRGDGTTSRLTPSDELSGEDVVPGFSCRVVDLFLELPAE
jgi:Uma2 family endonuclease